MKPKVIEPERRRHRLKGLREPIGWLVSLTCSITFSLAAEAQAKSDHSSDVHLDVRGLQRILDHNPKTRRPVSTINELLGLLPSSLRSNFTFVYDSRSPFGSGNGNTQPSISPMFPRVILFSDDARIMMTFTGDPNKAGSNILEAIEFSDSTSSFDLYKWDLSSGVKVSKNPNECLRCHGSDPRPIFDSYPLWPGFYGSIQDTFPNASKEGELYKKFLSEKKDDKRFIYSRLKWSTPGPVAPYLDPVKFNPRSFEGSVSEMKSLPNTRLGMALTELNRRRILRKLKTSPSYDEEKYGLLAGLLGCSKLPVAENELRELRKTIVREDQERIRRLGFAGEGQDPRRVRMFEQDFLEGLAELRTVARLLGVSMTDWSMALEPDSLSYFDGILSGIHENRSYYLKEDVIFEMFRDIALKDLDIEEHFSIRPAFAHLGCPFGNRLNIGSARKACGVLLRTQKKL